MAAHTILVARIGVLSMLFVLLPYTLSADTFTFNIAVDSFTPPPSGPPGPTLAPWSVSFQESQLLNFAVGGTIPGIDVTASGTPAATYSVFSIDFGRTGAGVDEFTVEWFSPSALISEFFYTSHYSTSTPPETTGTFVATDTLTQDTDGFQPGPSTTLTITQVQTPVPEPNSFTLVVAGLLGLAAIAGRRYTQLITK